MADRFQLYVDMGNAAFDDEGGGDSAGELVRILRVVADKIERQGMAPKMFQTIFDINGNDVGRFAAKPRDYR